MTGIKRQIAGVLGGLGPAATIDFMSKVVEMTPGDIDQDHVQMIVNHNPTVPDRQIDTAEQRLLVEKVLADMAKGLENAGANFLVMPCNSAHSFLDRARSVIDIPILHIVTETISAIRSLEPNAGAVGILATDACLKSNLYQSAIHKAGMRVLLPSVGEQASIMKMVYKIKGGDQTSDIGNEMTNRANSLIQQGADVIVGGCTEIPLVISGERLTVPFISSTDVLAEKTVSMAMAVLM